MLSDSHRFFVDVCRSVDDVAYFLIRLNWTSLHSVLLSENWERIEKGLVVLMDDPRFTNLIDFIDFVVFNRTKSIRTQLELYWNPKARHMHAMKRSRKTHSDRRNPSITQDIPPEADCRSQKQQQPRKAPERKIGTCAQSRAVCHNPFVENLLYRARVL